MNECNTQHQSLECIDKLTQHTTQHNTYIIADLTGAGFGLSVVAVAVGGLAAAADVPVPVAVAVAVAVVAAGAGAGAAVDAACSVPLICCTALKDPKTTKRAVKRWRDVIR
jgi:hypothetical protein